MQTSHRLQRGNEVTSDFWKDMIASIDHNYNTSAFRGELARFIFPVKS